MCSIEEAWAGQTFDGYRVQSQADLHRKYMPIADNLLTRNDEFSIAKKEPAPRSGMQGVNTKMVRPLHVPQQPHTDNNMNISFTDNYMPVDNYGGLEPRPGYMSIYDNAGQGLSMPMPQQTQATPGRSAFGDINQAFQVSPTVERFMARGGDNSNPLQNENTNDDRLVLARKFNSADTAVDNNQLATTTTASHLAGLSQVQASLQDILARLDRVEQALHHGPSRNMCDMVLYILVGMLIAFIIYSLLRK